MKNKCLIVILVIVLFIGIIGFFIGSKMKKEDSSDKKDRDTKVEIVEIKYSYGGGFGTEAYTAMKTITFTPDNNIKFSNSFDDSVEEYQGDDEDFEDLANFIAKRIDLFDQEVKSEDALDGGSEYIEIKLKNGKTKKFGGYMVRNQKFIEIKQRVFRIVEEGRLDRYERNIGK